MIAHDENVIFPIFSSAQRTSLWTITNLLASGDKALKVLIGQEVIKSLAHLSTNALDEGIHGDALKAIDVAVDSSVLRLVHLID